MLKFLLLALLSVTSASVALAQYYEMSDETDLRYFIQNDSIYKVNKIKTRTTYNLKEDVRDKKVLTLSFNTNGKIASILYEPFVNGQIQTIYYTYTEAGRIESMRAELIKGNEPNRAMLDFWGSPEETKKTLAAIPLRVVHTYKVEYVGDTLKTITRFDSAGNVVKQSIFSKGGSVRKFTEYKEDGTPKYISITDYISTKWFPKLVYEQQYDYNGWDKPFKKIYDYYPNENGVITERLEQEKYLSNTAKIEYNKNNLVIKSGEEITPVYIFEYEYY